MHIILPSLPVFLTVYAFLCWRLFRGAKAVVISFIFGIAVSLVPQNAALHALLPIAVILAACDVVAAWRGRRNGGEASAVDRACVGLAMIPALARQPFFLINQIYGAFAAPLALVLSLSFLTRRARAAVPTIVFLLGLCVGQGIDRWIEFRMLPMTWVELPGARLYLPPDEAAFVASATADIRATTPPNSYVGIFPEPGFLLFVTGRRNPFVYEAFYPGFLDLASEEEMIRRLAERHPEVLLITNRPFPEYGPGTLGTGVLDRFFTKVKETYVKSTEIDASQPLTSYRGRHATAGFFLRRRDSAGPGNSVGVP